MSIRAEIKEAFPEVSGEFFWAGIPDADLTKEELLRVLRCNVRAELKEKGLLPNYRFMQVPS